MTRARGRRRAAVVTFTFTGAGAQRGRARATAGACGPEDPGPARLAGGDPHRERAVALRRWSCRPRANGPPCSSATSTRRGFLALHRRRRRPTGSGCPRATELGALSAIGDGLRSRTASCAWTARARPARPRPGSRRPRQRSRRHRPAATARRLRRRDAAPHGDGRIMRSCFRFGGRTRGFLPAIGRSQTRPESSSRPVSGIHRLRYSVGRLTGCNGGGPFGSC